jgi:hypothetical protein
MLNVTDDVRMQADDEAGGDEDLAERLLACSSDPLGFVRLAFGVTLERWQAEVLEAIGNQLTENARLGRWKAVQLAVASGNGVGKTALLSWLILWGLMTFEDTLGVCTAGTEPQIRTRLWGELSKWYNQLPEALRGQFELTATAIFNRQAERGAGGAVGIVKGRYQQGEELCLKAGGSGEAGIWQESGGPEAAGDTDRDDERS